MFLIQLSHYGKEATGDFILCELIRLWETFESILQVDIQICVNCKILTISLGGNDKSMAVPWVFSPARPRSFPGAGSGSLEARSAGCETLLASPLIKYFTRY